MATLHPSNVLGNYVVASQPCRAMLLENMRPSCMIDVVKGKVWNFLRCVFYFSTRFLLSLRGFLKVATSAAEINQVWHLSHH